MVFNRFFFKILIRVLLITVGLSACTYLFPRVDLLFTQVILASIILLQIVELTYFLNKTNYDLARFLDSLKDGDFTIGFNKPENISSFDKLHTSFNELAHIYKSLETVNATQSHFLTQLVNQIDFGIVAFGEENQIILINNQAQSLLVLPAISNWEKIRNPNTQFLKSLLQANDVQNHLIETKIEGQDRFFSASIITIHILEKKYRIASFHDIKSELQVKEIESYQKLIKILNHEILNSVTPLISLSETIQLILQDTNQNRKSVKNLDQQNLDDIFEAVDTIKQRSEGILKFANDYRKLTRIPPPVFEDVSIDQLCRGVIRLHEKAFKDLKISVSYEKMEHIISLDRALVEQVLINVIKNAVEALVEIQLPEIKIWCDIDPKYFVLRISDNGHGITSDKLAKVFIPFYTTKNGGTGIGLSISRQIMSLHGGSLEIDTQSGKVTVVSLVFPISLIKEMPN